MSYIRQQHDYLCWSYQLHTDSNVIELFYCHMLHPVVPVGLVGRSDIIFLFGFPSGFIPSCANVRIYSPVPGFGKQLSILSGSFSKSSILLVGCRCERR